MSRTRCRRCRRQLPPRPPGKSGPHRLYCSKRCKWAASKRRCRSREPRFAFEPLVPYIERAYQPDSHFVTTTGVVGKAARVLNVNRTTVYRWVDNGMSLAQADAAAYELGQHPAAIWPDTWLRVPS